LQIFTKSLYFGVFDYKIWLGSLVSELCESKFIRMPVSCCSCRGSSENCYVT